jgi:hypothetical protein
MFLYVFVLFFLLTPGILLRLPPKGSPIIVAIVHAFVFTLLIWFTHNMMWNRMGQMSPSAIVEGMYYNDVNRNLPLI